jgi:arylsulfatase A-like enzyme
LTDPRKPNSDVSIFLLAAWFGLATGFAEVFILYLRTVYPLPYQTETDSFLLLSRHVIWMAPVADVIWFMTLGVGVLALTRIWPALGARRAATVSFCFLSVLSLLCMRLLPGMTLFVKALLSAGVALQATWFLGRRAAVFQRVVRRTLRWMTAAAGVAAVAVHVWIASDERRGMPRSTAAAGTPNVLLIVMDTVRAQSLSLYGYDRRTTPELERLAARSVVFERAFSTAPWTLPSMASVFTGRLPHETTADWWKPLDRTHPTLAGVLRDAGYVTGGFVANQVFVNREFGLNRGFGVYHVYRKSAGQIVLSSSLGRFFGCWLGAGIGCELRPLIGYYDALGRKRAATVNEEFLDWVSTRGDRPFFAFLNYMDAHHPYLPPEPFSTMFGSGEARRNPAKLRDDWSAPEAALERDAYEGAIASIDHEIGRLLGELERRRLLENTLVIVTADHGESFLGNGVMYHGNSLYRTQLQVPLLISFPARFPGGRRVHQEVSLRNIPATVLDVLDLQHTHTFPGNALSSYWKENRSVPGDEVVAETSGLPYEPRTSPVSRGDMKSAIIGPYHYIRNGDGSEELYDIEHDPQEQVNRIGDLDSVVARFRSLVARH